MAINGLNTSGDHFRYQFVRLDDFLQLLKRRLVGDLKRPVIEELLHPFDLMVELHIEFVYNVPEKFKGAGTGETEHVDVAFVLGEKRVDFLPFGARRDTARFF